MKPDSLAVCVAAAVLAFLIALLLILTAGCATWTLTDLDTPVARLRLTLEPKCAPALADLFAPSANPSPRRGSDRIPLPGEILEVTNLPSATASQAPAD